MSKKYIKMDLTVTVCILIGISTNQISAKSTRLYDVQLEDVEQISNGIFMNSGFFIEKYNQTLNVLNGDISILQDMPITTTVHVIGHEKRGNDYQPSMIDVVMNICEFLEEKHVKEIFLTKSNFPKECPVSEGNYKVTNMMAESEDLPQHLTGKYWMMQFIFRLEEEVIGDIKMYATIDRTRAAKATRKRS